MGGEGEMSCDAPCTIIFIVLGVKRLTLIDSNKKHANKNVPNAD